MYDLTMYDWDYSSYHKCLHRRGYLAVLTPIVHRQIVNNFIPKDFRPGRRRCRPNLPYYSSYHKCLHRRGYLAVLTPIVHRQIVNNFIPKDFRPGRRRCRPNLPCPEGRSDGHREVLNKEEYDDVEGGIITGNFVRTLLTRTI